MNPNKTRDKNIRAISKIKALAHPDSNCGVKRVVRWLSSREGKEFVRFLHDSAGFCDLFHTDDYQTAFYRLIDRSTEVAQ